MPRLVIVSNRVGPLQDSAKAGGLAVALVDVLRKTGGLWFGWSGEVSEAGTQSEFKIEEARKVRLVTIDITAEDAAHFYAGYANRTLWPTMHYRLDIADFDRRFEAAYHRVNERFAARLRPLLEPDDIIWVHDYHFLRLGAELRALGVENPIGFFLHIPFPGPEILTAVPRHDVLLRAMLAYDLIGFQTHRDRDAFMRSVTEEVAAAHKLDDDTVEFAGRQVAVKAFPIGIDTAGFAKFAVSADARAHEKRVKATLAGKQQIIGVDRIDYSKGLPERFRAFERLLELYPENRGKVSFIQIAPPSRMEVDAYAAMRRNLERLAGHINGRFADIDWTPIRFLTRGQPRKSLAGLYRASRVGLVTPLRDGMNLVAKEFIAAQPPEDPGVLLLSRFAGAAEEMREALIVNPYSPEGVADAMQNAIQMPLDERQDRWRRLYDRIQENDAAAWAKTFLADLRSAAAANRTAMQVVPPQFDLPPEEQPSAA